MSGPARVASLYRYPVKGLSGERLKNVFLEKDATFPADRSYAIENGPSDFDPAAPSWQPKIKFLCLMRNAKLAALEALFDDKSGVLAVSKNGVPMVEASMQTDAGRAAIEHFFHEFMGGEARGPLRVLEAPGHSFSDVSAKVAHVVSLASLADLGTSLGRNIEPLRFRANIYVDGWEPWIENDLVGRTLAIGGVTFKITKRTTRCAATEVNPDTTERDIDVTEALWRKTGDTDCGIYASAIEPGKISEGDEVRITG